MARSQLKLASFNDSLLSVMVRGIDGNILFWNRAAERQYGYSRGQAVGKISHRLLNTVFPCPLDEINKELMTRGYWEGKLIHNLSDGSRVKVMSRWILQDEPEAARPAVVEMNNAVQLLAPESSYLTQPQPSFQRLLSFLLRNWLWWAMPIFAALILVWSLIEFGADLPLRPD